jgi:hypothetical protein
VPTWFLRSPYRNASVNPSLDSFIGVIHGAFLVGKTPIQCRYRWLRLAWITTITHDAKAFGESHVKRPKQNDAASPNVSFHQQSPVS